VEMENVSESGVAVVEEELFPTEVVEGPKDEVAIETPAGTAIVKRKLKVALSDAETATLGHELAGELKRLELAEEAKKDDAASHTSIIKAIHGTVDRIRDEIRSGKREVEFEVRREPDYGAGVFRFFRVDTGEELTPEAMTDEDRQRALFDQKAQDEAAVAAAGLRSPASPRPGRKSRPWRRAQKGRKRRFRPRTPRRTAKRGTSPRPGPRPESDRSLPRPGDGNQRVPVVQGPDRVGDHVPGREGTARRRAFGQGEHSARPAAPARAR
jgi:hypothetical protein